MTFNTSHKASKPETGAQIDELLVFCALGKLPKSLDVLVKSHIELKPEAGQFFKALEASAANKMSGIETHAQVASRQDRLDTIFASRHFQVQPEIQPDNVLPVALHDYIGKSINGIGWRWRMPGLKEYKIASEDGYEASLLWIKAGRKMPAHTHDGMEVTLVLKGSFGDEHEHYARGDVAVADCDIDHSPKAGLEEDCICLVVTDAPLRLTGKIGHFFHKIFGN